MKKILASLTLLISSMLVSSTSILALDPSCTDPKGNHFLGKQCAPDQYCFYNPPGDPTQSDSYSCESQNAPKSILGQIQPPPQVSSLGFGSAGLSNLINKLLTFIYIAASIVFIVFVVYSGLEWIMSGGDKEKVESARKRLTYAIIGVVVLALSFVIIRVIGQITGFKFFVGQLM